MTDIADYGETVDIQRENDMKQINQFLQSQAAVLLLLALALLAQTPHTASVFHRLANPTSGTIWHLGAGWMHAAFYAVALEFATLLFVVRGNTRLSWTFAAVSVLANAAYYWRDNMQVSYMASALLISLALPACIAFYSHGVAAQDTPAEPAADKPKRKAKPVITEDDTEALLADVDMANGTLQDDISAYWQAAFARTKRKGQADKMTGEQFGKSTRTVARLREGWQVA